MTETVYGRYNGRNFWRNYDQKAFGNMTHIELKSVAMRPNHLAENVSYGLKSLTAAISVTAEFRLLLIYFLRLRCFGKNSLSVTHYFQSIFSKPPY